MSREIMQQALDTLDRLWEIGVDAEYGVPLLPIMHVLRQELAKPEQEFKYTEYGLRGDENGKLSIGEIPRKECDVHECRRKVREADDDSSLAGAIIYRK